LHHLRAAKKALTPKLPPAARRIADSFLTLIFIGLRFHLNRLFSTLFDLSN
jgi:hypothetical protein